MCVCVCVYTVTSQPCVCMRVCVQSGLSRVHVRVQSGLSRVRLCVCLCPVRSQPCACVCLCLCPVRSQPCVRACVRACVCCSVSLSGPVPLSPCPRPSTEQAGSAREGGLSPPHVRTPPQWPPPRPRHHAPPAHPDGSTGLRTLLPLYPWGPPLADTRWAASRTPVLCPSSTHLAFRAPPDTPSGSISSLFSGTGAPPPLSGDPPQQLLIPTQTHGLSI